MTSGNVIRKVAEGVAPLKEGANAEYAVDRIKPLGAQRPEKFPILFKMIFAGYGQGAGGVESVKYFQIGYSDAPVDFPTVPGAIRYLRINLILPDDMIRTIFESIFMIPVTDRRVQTSCFFRNGLRRTKQSTRGGNRICGQNP